MNKDKMTADAVTALTPVLMRNVEQRVSAILRMAEEDEAAAQKAYQNLLVGDLVIVDLFHPLAKILDALDTAR